LFGRRDFEYTGGGLSSSQNFVVGQDGYSGTAASFGAVVTRLRHGVDRRHGVERAGKTSAGAAETMLLCRPGQQGAPVAQPDTDSANHDAV